MVRPGCIPIWVTAAIEDSGLIADDPEEVAFGLGKYLFDRACDFDYLDFESLARAKPKPANYG